MSSVPESAISIEDGEITIDAELVASKLGVSTASFKAGMTKGIASTFAETGMDEDVGRTRLTFRYRWRTWTIVVDPDGSFSESMAPAPTASPTNTDRVSPGDLIRRGS